MKKVLVKAYLCNNLGDDLLVAMLVKRYPKAQFYSYSRFRSSFFAKMDNFHYLESSFDIAKDIFMGRVFHKYDFTETSHKKDYDCLVQIGGSIFIENNNFYTWTHLAKNYHFNDIPYFILGCNVGPWTNDNYPILLKEEIFTDAQSVTFRDSFSYNLYADMPNTFMADDIVFGLKDCFNVTKTSEKRVVISVIDMDGRNIPTDAYEDQIIKAVNYYQNLGYDITLMSFCRLEGDEKAINRLMNKLDNKEHVSTYLYGGNVDEAVDLLASSEIIIASRFHATVLAIALDKKFIPIAYSKKLTNILNDLDYQGPLYDKDNIHEFTPECLANHSFNSDELRINARKHFTELNKVIYE